MRSPFLRRPRAPLHEHVGGVERVQHRLLLPLLLLHRMLVLLLLLHGLHRLGMMHAGLLLLLMKVGARMLFVYVDFNLLGRGAQHLTGSSSVSLGLAIS